MRDDGDVTICKSGTNGGHEFGVESFQVAEGGPIGVLGGGFGDDRHLELAELKAQQAQRFGYLRDGAEDFNLQILPGENHGEYLIGGEEVFEDGFVRRKNGPDGLERDQLLNGRQRRRSRTEMNFTERGKEFLFAG